MRARTSTAVSRFTAASLTFLLLATSAPVESKPSARRSRRGGAAVRVRHRPVERDVAQRAAREDVARLPGDAPRAAHVLVDREERVAGEVADEDHRRVAVDEADLRATERRQPRRERLRRAHVSLQHRTVARRDRHACLASCPRRRVVVARGARAGRRRHPGDEQRHQAPPHGASGDGGTTTGPPATTYARHPPAIDVTSP